ncbi:MAG: FAD-binding protein, partial [Bacteriovoracaceae bacterium]
REKVPEVANTYWAQGGVVYSQKVWDDEDSLVEDINKASSNTSNLKAAKLLAQRSSAILEEIFIQKANTEFDRDKSGALLFTKEAAHSKARIIYKGDYTGKAIQVSLLNYLNNKERFPNVTFLTGHTAIDLITPNHHGCSIQQRYEADKVAGAYVYNQDSSDVKKVLAKKTILATGGIGALYLHNSNAAGSRGDGHAMAARAGAQMVNMEFIQFHPTTFYSGTGHRRFLVSEAVRGEGGRLMNSKGEAFMEKYHRDKELAPRDVVARAILSEMIALKDDYVYLDISHKDQDWIKKRFPTIYKYCQEHKVDITKEPIPVVPAAHYTCGGVKTDLDGRTNLKSLYAVGEVACNGLHGANRLASTSLLEGVTFGYIAAENILKNIGNETLYDSSKIKDWRKGSEPIDLGLVSQDIMTIKQTMWNYLGLTRSKNRLARARAMFREMSDEIHSFYRHAALHDELIGLRNGVEVAYMVLNASVRNKESVGCFYREN